MKKIKNVEVAKIFNNYPDRMRKKLLFLRQLIFDTALETEGVGNIEETIKWGEPSYVTKGGSTIRIDWNSSSPEKFAIYFHCKTKLVDTFREVYGDKFTYETNRAITFNESDDIPVEDLKHCISLALTYHQIKNLPLLGL